MDTGQGKITPRTAGGRPRAVSCARPQEFGEPGIGSATGLDKTGFVQFFFLHFVRKSEVVVSTLWKSQRSEPGLRGCGHVG